MQSVVTINGTQVLTITIRLEGFVDSEQDLLAQSVFRNDDTDKLPFLVVFYSDSDEDCHIHLDTSTQFIFDTLEVPEYLIYQAHGYTAIFSDSLVTLSSLFESIRGLVKKSRNH